MSLFSNNLEQMATALIAHCTAQRLTLTTAESCTGGLIAGLLTEIAGSSAVIDRGYVTYSNRAKAELLGVPELTLESFGAVSRQTAIAMAKGALFRSGVDLSVAVTGIAGPGGGTAQKPVGLVHLAATNRDGRLLHREMRYGDLGRENVRLATIHTALELLTEITER